MSGKSNFIALHLPLMVVFVILSLFFPSNVHAADYTVTSSAELRAAISAAAANAADDRIVINAEGVYDGPFIVPQNAYSVTIVGSSGLDREKIVLTNEDSKIFTRAPLIPHPVVFAFGFNPLDHTQGTAVTLKHLTVAPSQLLDNGRMEGEYTTVASGWSKSGNISPVPVIYGWTDGVDVVSGYKSQKFSGSPWLLNQLSFRHFSALHLSSRADPNPTLKIWASINFCIKAAVCPASGFVSSPVRRSNPMLIYPQAFFTTDLNPPMLLTRF